jgi:hypothetical protein
LTPGIGNLARQGRQTATLAALIFFLRNRIGVMTDRNSYPIRLPECDPIHWRKRIRMTLEKASCSEAGPKERLLRVAREYQRMAKYAEARQARQNNGI